MSLKRTTQVSQDDPRALATAVNTLLDSAKYSDVVITFASGVTQRVPHKLGRKLVGWQVIRINFSGNVYEVSSVSQDTTREIAMTASASGTATVRFF